MSRQILSAFGNRMKIINPYRFTSGGSILVSDAFTDTNGTLLTAHTPDVDTVGGGWLGTSSCDIQSNRAQGNSTAGRENWIECSTADVVISGDLSLAASVGGDKGPGLIARVADANNYWLGIMWKTVIRIYEKTSGSYTQRASTAFTAATETDYPATLTVSGTSITFNVDGTEISYTSSTHQTNTKHGVRCDGGNTISNGSRVDNFQITG